MLIQKFGSCIGDCAGEKSFVEFGRRSSVKISAGLEYLELPYRYFAGVEVAKLQCTARHDDNIRRLVEVH